MDERAVISGILAATAIVAGTTLALMRIDAANILFGLASTFGGYVVGLYSEPSAKQSRENDGKNDA